METTTITEEFISRMDDELKYNSKVYRKDGEPFGAQALSSMAGGSFPSVDLWHGLWYQGEMACLFGEPNVGKTILAMQIANELNKRGLKTLYFDFENAAHQFKSRYKTDKFNYSTGDGEFIVKPLNPNYSTAPLDSRSILDYIKKDFVTERAPVIIIDDITHLIGSGDQADVRYVLNTLRSWTQHFMVSILVLAHSKRRKPSSLTTIDSLAGSFEYSYAFDSIFSLTRANKYNEKHYNITHYIKHHKNRMGPVSFNELNVITAQFGRDENNGFLQFNNLYTGGNERQLLRDNGYKNYDEINKAIIQYYNLHFSTREIANLVGSSQTHVCRTIHRYVKQQQIIENTPKLSQNEQAGDNSSLKLEGDIGEVCNDKDVLVYPSQPYAMPRIKLEPDLTPIYDASQYTIDPYGQRITIEEYNLYYNEENQDYDEPTEPAEPTEPTEPTETAEPTETTETTEPTMNSEL